MTLWLVGQYLKHPSAWFVSLMSAIVILQWPTVGMSIAIAVLLLQLQTIPGRATLFDAALPILARDVVAARLFARLVLFAVPAISYVVVWHGNIAGSPLTPFFMYFAAFVALLQVVPMCVQAHILDLPTSRRLVLPLAAMAVGSGLTLWLVPDDVGALMLFGVALALVAFTVATMPASFTRMSSGRRTGITPLPTTSARRHPATAAISAWWPLLHSVTSWQVCTLFVFVILGGWADSWPLYIVMFSVSAHLALRQRTAWLATLPLSHRARLLAVVVPLCVSALGGLAIGRTVHYVNGADRYMSRNAPSSPYEKGKYFSSPTRVSLTYWKRVPQRALPPGSTFAGQQVEVVTPWGERAVADTFSILGAMYFNPYTTGQQSSARFVEWQFGRAATAVYGRPISQRDYDNEAIPHPPQVTDAWRIQLLGAGLTVAFLLYTLLVHEIPMSAYASRVSTAWASGAPLVLLFLPIAVIGGICVYFSHDRGAAIAMPMLARGLLAVVRILPDNVFVIALVAALPPLLVYAVLERLFSRSEVPRVPAPRT